MIALGSALRGRLFKGHVAPPAPGLLGSLSVQLTSLRRMVCSVMLLELEMAWWRPALGGLRRC